MAKGSRITSFTMSAAFYFCILPALQIAEHTSGPLRFGSKLHRVPKTGIQNAS
jgi:hypothetical protein